MGSNSRGGRMDSCQPGVAGDGQVEAAHLVQLLVVGSEWRGLELCGRWFDLLQQLRIEIELAVPRSGGIEQSCLIVGHYTQRMSVAARQVHLVDLGRLAAIHIADCNSCCKHCVVGDP